MATKRIKTETYILPAYWASALVNGDFSGMEDRDEQDLNTWLNKVNPGYCVGCSEESYFAWRNDVSYLAGDVLEYYFHKPAKVKLSLS